MITMLAPAIVLAVGLLLYALATNGKVQEIGRIMFFCGMLVVTYLLASHSVALLR